jgi:hypothetical protein
MVWYGVGRSPTLTPIRWALEACGEVRPGTNDGLRDASGIGGGDGGKLIEPDSEDAERLGAVREWD